MVDSVGRQLHRARIARGIPLEQAAKETRIRSERIVDLENDDYGNFPNLAYAKGFLVIYSKYLNVDLSEFTRSFDTGSVVGVDDYAYLRSEREEFQQQPVKVQRNNRATPALALGALLVLCVLTVTGMFVWSTAQRLGLAGPPLSPIASNEVPQAETPTPPPEPVAKPEPAPIVVATPAPVELETTLPVFRAEPVETINIPASNPVEAGTSPEISLRPLRRTWVVIRQGSPSAEPIFQDYLEPTSPPMNLRGANFFIELNDASGVEISKNGQPVAYHPPGVVIP